MKPARVRFIVAAAIFVGWLCWLGYLAATKTNPVVVSHSQVMASTHFVLADVSVEPDTRQPVRDVKVIEDLQPTGEPLPAKIRVSNLKEARVAGADGFREHVVYLLLLTKVGTEFVLTPPPRAPGAEGVSRLRPWAYFWDAPGVKEQFEALVPKRPAG